MSRKGKRGDFSKNKTPPKVRKRRKTYHDKFTLVAVSTSLVVRVFGTDASGNYVVA
jgi:hypothetical protein